MMRTPASGTLIGHRHAGLLGLRPLAPLPSMAMANQSNVPDRLGCARPFVPSSPSSKPRPGATNRRFHLDTILRRSSRRNSPVRFFTRRMPSEKPFSTPLTSYLTNPVRNPDVTRDSDFPMKSPIEKNSVFPPHPSGVRRPTERLTLARQISSETSNHLTSLTICHANKNPALRNSTSIAQRKRNPLPEPP